MARIEVAAEVIDDLDRFLAHMVKHGAVDAGDRVDEILQAVGVLETSPMIGRPVRGDKRELVIGKGVRGYVALYRYLEDIDTVFILALRPQRESAFKH